MTGGAVPFWRRLPQRGFTNAPFRRDHSIVNVHQLNRFAAGAVVGPDELAEAGLLKQPAKAGVKILGDGELSKPLTVRADAFSKSARDKIEGAGGTVETIPGPRPPVRRKMHSAPEPVEE
jgi:large subunit ribosomal protein L15